MNQIKFHFIKRWLCLLAIMASLLHCNKAQQNQVPVIAFLDLLQDETLAQAKDGFYKALADSGYSESKKNITIIYRNAQNDRAALLQADAYLKSKQPLLIATCPTLSTLTALNKNDHIPVFMMVSPSAEIAQITQKNGRWPAQLSGVYETHAYLDTSLMLMKQLKPDVARLGIIYNQSEPQSMQALNHMKQTCQQMQLELIAQPVTNSNEVMLNTKALLQKKVDAFFAMPDNTVFSAMEIIVQLCDVAQVPVFTSEEGLVKRGAVAAFGADMFAWGYQTGAAAAAYIRTKDTKSAKL
jgi:putative tryptophan/tyrosine transport system substrate-binding protein